MEKFSRVSLNSGRQMPVLGLGTWELTDDTAETIEAALHLGYRMIDTSADYETQPDIGRALNESGIPRDEIYLVSKVEEDEDALEATKKNLGEMDQEYSDLVVIHRPPDQGAGRDLWIRLLEARDAGLARDVGVSNYSIEEMEELMDATGETPAVNQIEWTPFGYSREMLDFCRDRGIVIQSYSPLTRTERLDDERLVEIAERYGKTPGQILVRWNLQLGTVPLPKSGSREHLEENIDVFDFEISESDMETLNGFNEHYSALTELQYI